MRSELKEAIRRLHSRDYHELVTGEKRRKNGGRKRFWRLLPGRGFLAGLTARRAIFTAAIVGAALFIIATTGAGVYYFNRFSLIIVDLDKTKSFIDNEVKRRADLIPNLVIVSAEYSAHEKVLYKYVSEMRRGLADAKQGVPQAVAALPVPDLLSSLLAVAEEYPDLKATQSFELLMQEWTETENRIADARADYIKTIRELNGLCSTFPSNVYALLFRVHKYEPFVFDDNGLGGVRMEEFYSEYLARRDAAEADSDG